MKPTTFESPRRSMSTTATSLLSALATKRRSPAAASAIGVEPIGALACRDVRMTSVTRGGGIDAVNAVLVDVGGVERVTARIKGQSADERLLPIDARDVQ